VSQLNGIGAFAASRDIRLQCWSKSRGCCRSVFETLQKNLASIDFSILLNGVMTIADEVDSQLSQAMDSYLEESLLKATSV
jgi:hypothetical protein